MPARVPEVLTERDGFLRKIIHSFELVMINNVGLPDWLVTTTFALKLLSKLLYGFVKFVTWIIVLWICQRAGDDAS